MAAPHNNNIKQKILDAAVVLLSDKPFNEVSLAEIARVANVSKGSVYYYYKSKDDLLYDITDSYLQEYYDALIIWVEDSSKDTSLPRLLRYVLSYGINDPSNSTRLHLTVDAIDHNEITRKKLLDRYHVFRKVIGEKIAQRKSESNDQYYGWLTLFVIDGIMIQKLLQNSELEIDKFIEDFIQDMNE